jgi:hypothetical protein
LYAHGFLQLERIESLMENANTAHLSGIEQAIAAAGSQDKLAEALGCTQQNISFWKAQGFAPTSRIVEIEQRTGVPRALLINPRVADLLSNNV